MLHNNKDNESPWVGKCVLPKEIQDTQCGVIIDLWFNDDKELTYEISNLVIKLNIGKSLKYWKDKNKFLERMWIGNHKKM